MKDSSIYEKRKEGLKKMIEERWVKRNEQWKEVSNLEEKIIKGILLDDWIENDVLS
jgi:hypothetical protein